MKTIAVSIIIVSFSLFRSGQGKSEWLGEDIRRVRYPAGKYFTGFVFDEASAGKPLQEQELFMTYIK